MKIRIVPGSTEGTSLSVTHLTFHGDNLTAQDARLGCDDDGHYFGLPELPTGTVVVTTCLDLDGCTHNQFGVVGRAGELVYVTNEYHEMEIWRERGQLAALPGAYILRANSKFEGYGFMFAGLLGEDGDATSALLFSSEEAACGFLGDNKAFRVERLCTDRRPLGFGPRN